MNPLDYLRDKRRVVAADRERLVSEPSPDAQPRNDLVVRVPAERNPVGGSADDLLYPRSQGNHPLSVTRLTHGGQPSDHAPVLAPDSDTDAWYCQACGDDLDLVLA